MRKSNRLKRREPDETEDWGKYMELKKKKLQEQFISESENVVKSMSGSKLFEGVSIFVNGFTVPSADELRLLMMKYGGVYHHYHRPRVTTHIIASNLPDTKIKQLNFDKIKIVKPEWITDSIKENKVLDYKMYMLYSNQSRAQPKLMFDTVKGNKNENPVKSNTEEELKEKCLKSKCVVRLLPNDRILVGKNHSNSLSCVDTNSSKLDGSDIIEGDIILKPETLESSTGNNNMEIHDSKEKAVQHLHSEPDNSKPAEKCSLVKPNPQYSKTASDEDFLNEFYSHSRLHLISTMGSTFKQYINDLREKNDNSFPGLEQLKRNSQEKAANLELIDEEKDFGSLLGEGQSKENIIMHIDMDCFFVSVGIRNRPELKGQPVAVTHAKANAQVQPRKGMDRKAEIDLYRNRSKDRYKSKSTLNQTSNNFTKSVSDNVNDNNELQSGWVDVIGEFDSMSEIASCSYEARRAGLKNGMFLGQAIKLCPDLKTIPYDFEDYKEVSYALYNTVAEFTLNIEAVSCDEMFVDCSELLEKSCSTPLEFATFLRQRIKDRTGCPCSTGFGVNRLQARLATKKAKPDGQYHISSREASNFMRDIKVSDLPGVGRSLAFKLSEIGIQTCGDLQREKLSRLQKLFGIKTGVTLHKHCRGIDDRVLTFGHVRKSVSAEVNYGIRFKNQKEADDFIQRLCCEVEKRLQDVQMKARCITLKLMVKAKGAPQETAKFLGHGVCDNITKSSSLNVAVSDVSVILREVMMIYKKLNLNAQDLRGIGIQLSRLESDKSTRMNRAIDKFLRPNSKSSAIESVISSLSTGKNQCGNKTGLTPIKNIYEMDACNYMHSVQSADHDCLPRLDEEVLAALPQDIKSELSKDRSFLIQQMRIQNEKPELKSLEQNSSELLIPEEENNFTLSEINESFLSALPSCLKEEIEERALQNRQKKRQNCGKITSSGAILDAERENGCSVKKDNFSMKEVREMVREWVSVEPEPQNKDISMFGSLLGKFVYNHQLENLKIIINTLRRSISLKDCTLPWEMGYANIIEQIQKAMRIEYGGTLYLDPGIRGVDS